MDGWLASWQVESLAVWLEAPSLSDGPWGPKICVPGGGTTEQFHREGWTQASATCLF